jgi:hypothetical protein
VDSGVVECVLCEACCGATSSCSPTLANPTHFSKNLEVYLSGGGCRTAGNDFPRKLDSILEYLTNVGFEYKVHALSQTTSCTWTGLGNHWRPSVSLPTMSKGSAVLVLYSTKQSLNPFLLVLVQIFGCVDMVLCYCP